MDVRRRFELRSVGLVAFIVTMFSLFCAYGATAQERGSVHGRVADANNRLLPGATVHVEPGAFAVVTDREGFYAVPSLPPATYRVEVSYIGFVAETREVAVAAGSAARADFKLVQDIRVAENVVVSASRERGEVEALNERKASENIVNVLPAEVITSLPNANLADAIGRLPSVALERDEGEGKYVEVRGLEPRLTSVTINGVHVPTVSGSNEGFGRQIKLDAFPSDLVGAVELYKTTSPDQDGDAIGGSLNLATRVAGDETSTSLSLLGGYNGLQSGRYSYQASGTYTSRFGENKELGVVLNGSYDWNGRAINDIEPGSAIVTLPSGESAGVFTALDLRDYRYERSRYGVAGGLDYRASEGTSLYLRGLLAQFKNYGDRWVTGISAGEFLTPTRTDDSGGYEATVQNRRPNEQTYSISLGGKSSLRTLLVDYDVSYSHARQDRVNQQQAGFDGPSAAFEVDSSNGYFPRFTPIGIANPLDPSLYTLSSFSRSDQRSNARAVALGVNASMPYLLGEHPSVLKIGGKYRDEDKTNSQHDRFFNVADGTTYLLSQGLDSFTDSHYYFNDYPQGPNASLAAVTHFFDTNPNAFVENVNREHLRNDPNNFEAKEKIGAFYAMNTTSFGPLDVRLGVRVEHTNATYSGFLVQSDPNGKWMSTSPTSGGSTYTNALPSISFKYAIDPSSTVRLVYGWQIGRPDYGLLAPSFIESDSRKQINAGNPNLKPTKSRSYDLLFEHYFGSLGVVSAGGFYKDLKDPIYPGASTTIHGGVFDGFQQVQPINGPSAKIYGAEVGWQQHLSFLPGVLSGLGVDTNYTYTDSKATFDPATGRSGTARLQRTVPRIFNLGLTYDRGGFSMRAALTYNAATIFLYNFQDGADGGLNGPNGDTYLYPHTQVDAQASYTLSNGLAVVLSALNINNAVFGFYNGDPHWNLQREFYSRTVALGFRLNR